MAEGIRIIHVGWHEHQKDFRTPLMSFDKLRMSGDRCFPSAPLRVNSGGRVLEAEEFNHLLSMTGSVGEAVSRLYRRRIPLLQVAPRWAYFQVHFEGNGELHVWKRCYNRLEV